MKNDKKSDGFEREEQVQSQVGERKSESKNEMKKKTKDCSLIA